MSEWTTVRLAEVADVRFSNVDKKTIPGECPVRLCNYMDVYGNDYITAGLPFMEASASRAEIARFGIEQGDVMITKDSETPDDIGISAVVSDEIENLVCGYHLALIKPDKARIDPVYLCKQLSTAAVVGYLGQRANGSTRYGLSSSAIARIEIPLTRLPQQRRIAEVLGTVDEAIEQTEALIAKQQQMKAGLMHDLFTRGVASSGQLRPLHVEAPHIYKESPLGFIPNEWELVKVGDLLSGIDAGWSPDCDETPPPEGEWGVLKVSAVTGGVFRSEESKTLPPTLTPILELEVKSGDVITARANGVAELVGVTVQVLDCRPKLMLSDKLLRLRPNQHAIGSFIAGIMTAHSTRRQIDGLMSGSSGQRNVGQTQIRNLATVRPPIEEQRMIERGIRIVETGLHESTAHLAKLRQLKQGLMQDLLTGRVPVPI